MVDVSGSHPRSLRPTYPVRGERLLLRPLAIGDADTLLGYRSREDVCRYVPFEPMSRDDIIERIAGHWARTELTDEGQSLTLGAQVGKTGELVGDVVLFWRSRAHAGGELGYVFNPALGGRGYATEAANVMLRLGFEGLGLHRIVARIDDRNEQSVRLARRLGMRQEARRPDAAPCRIAASRSSHGRLGPHRRARCSPSRHEGTDRQRPARQASVVLADDLLRRPVIGNPQGRYVGRQPCQPRSHAGRVPGVRTVEPLPERNLYGLDQRLTRLGGQLPGQ
jgi:RimJ/RimL family protein N-acetyltransferase